MPSTTNGSPTKNRELVLLEIKKERKSYLAAQLEVAHHNGDFGTGQNENDKYNQQEAKQIVELVQPDRGKDEEKFNEDSSERKDTAHQNREDGLHVPDLIWHLSGDLVYTYRGISHLLEEVC